MSLHETLRADISAIIGEQAGVSIISPTSVALAMLNKYGTPGLEMHIQYASLEHFKQMARKALSGRYDAESDESEAHQADLFSGHLQTRYPTPRKRGDDPLYKLLEALTDDEVRWNVQTLRRSADARQLHADALEAWGQHRSDPACAA
jgi:hypothetical protein